MLFLPFRPFATVWLWFPPHSVGLQSPIPAFTFVLTFSPRDIVWLCWSDIPPAFTFVLTFIVVFPFFEFDSGRLPPTYTVEKGMRNCWLGQIVFRVGSR